jgi:hypothetical protein
MYNTLMQPSGTPGTSPETEQQNPSEPQSSDSTTDPGAEAGWQYKAGEEDRSNQAPGLQPVVAVNWQASEYIAHDKNAGWYVLVTLTSIAVSAVVYLITRDRVSPVVVLILGMLFAVFGARKPQVLDYSISNTGVHIGRRHYPYSMFRTFSILEEEAVRSILLMPLQRFNLPISIYYDPADETKIVDALGSYLPHEDRKAGPIDNFMRKIHF